MTSERATQVAKHIFDDLKVNAYYADPHTLGDFMKAGQRTAADRERAAVEVLRYLLQKYTPRRPTDKDIEELARMLEGSGIR